jgi:hypothetical protein
MPTLNPLKLISDFAGQLRYPMLLAITAAAFVADLVIPDLVPFADEILLGLLTALFASLRRRRAPAADERAT